MATAKAHIAFGKVREKGESTILNDLVILSKFIM
jgi:hypothetical protein